ncbi:multidrug transporter [Halopseudomonas pachastrellae]|uniref:multidrug transporter n=1 Tax=Halopseudomonas pachastrellae TaxID=254161 RepID=UPI003D7CC911|tara:strand:+ start:16088 stop:16420 length:333 start_codon:yes stop_codon:yes gene_type:complete
MRLLRHSTALIAGLLMSASVMAADSYNEYHQDEPGYFAMVGDLVIARPLLLGVTLVGAGAFLVSLPFSAMGGNVGEAGHELVIRPAEETFVRCLGCSRVGYGRKQQDEVR